MEPKKEERPWGWFKTFAKNEKCTVKILHVNAGQKLSKQYHHKRDELWVALDNNCIVELNDRVLLPKKGEETRIERGTVHRLSSEKGGEMLEISFGEFDENDIIRKGDIYGRA